MKNIIAGKVFHVKRMSLHLVKFYLMRKLLCITVALLTLNTACNNKENAEAEKQRQDSLLQAQEDSLLEVFRGELEVIATKVNEVGAGSGLFEIDTTEGMVLSKEVIIDRVESLDALLQNNQKRLNDLSAMMRESKVRNTELENMLKNMQERIAERESQIDDLMKMLADKDVQIEEIKVRVDSMRVANIELTEEVIKMDEQMHEVYYAIGDGKELREKGIITKEGSVLGLGGAKKLDVSKLDHSLFKMVDQRDLNSIPLFSKKAQLITSHPQGSYEFKLDANGGVETLEITDKNKFWTATDYLVIEVMN